MQPNTIVYEHEQVMSRYYIVIKGSLYQLKRDIKSQDSMVVRLLTYPDNFGEESMFNLDNQSQFQIRASEEGCILCYLENQGNQTFLE